MDTVFMNSKKIKTSKPHVLIPHFTDSLLIRFKKRRKKHCFIRSEYLLHMEKHKKLIQK